MTAKSAADEMSPRVREVANAAAALFRRSGYRETTIRDIAAALDIKSATLYYHFKNKDDIIFAIAQTLMLDFVDQVTPVLNTNDDALEAIAAVVDAHLRFDLSRLDAVLVSSRERRSLPSEQQRPINALRARHRTALTNRIADVEAGPGAMSDPRVAASALLDLLNGVKEWYHAPRDGGIDALVANYQRYALAVVRAARGWG